MVNMDTKALRNAFATAPCVVSLVTAWEGDKPRGITISSFVSLSLSPPLCMYALEKSARRYAFFPGAKEFSICIFAKDQEGAAYEFSKGDAREVWDKFGYTKSEVLALPILNGAKAHFEFKLSNIYEGGDHVIIVGELVSYRVLDDKAPLVFYMGKFNSFNSL